MRMVLFLLASSLAAQPVRIVLAGDSTVNDEGGWGPGFRARFSAEVTVVNEARNGRSSKSFRDEGHWAKVLAAKPDYILIQFGHNDVPGKGPARETDPETSYAANLTRYLAEARAIGATPVLVTSIVRRAFTPDGRFKPDSLEPYVQATKKVAAAERVPLMDLYTLTRRQAEEAGPEGAKAIGRVTQEGKQDNTHLGPAGQQSIGRLAAAEFVRVVPRMAKYTR